MAWAGRMSQCETSGVPWRADVVKVEHESFECWIQALATRPLAGTVMAVAGEEVLYSLETRSLIERCSH